MMASLLGAHLTRRFSNASSNGRDPGPIPGPLSGTLKCRARRPCSEAIRGAKSHFMKDDVCGTRLALAALRGVDRRPRERSVPVEQRLRAVDMEAGMSVFSPHGPAL